MDFLLIFQFIGLIVSLIFLWLAGDFSVDYSIRMADIFNINTLFIGFALISVATGLPELSIIFISYFKNMPAISAGTILGSNVCDISLILGLPIVLYGALKIDKKEAKDSLFLLFITAFSMAFIFIVGDIGKIFGLLFILVYFWAIAWLWNSSTKREGLGEEKIQEKVISKYFKLHVSLGKGGRQKPGRASKKEKILIILKFLAGIILVLASSEFAVRFALVITKKLALSIHVISSTIFAIGTSLPEITLSLNAMKKKEYSLALGNSLGSVLEQGTFLMGVLALVEKKPIDVRAFRGISPFMFFSFFIIAFSILGRKKIGRIEAILMLISFILFLGFQIF